MKARVLVTALCSLLCVFGLSAAASAQEGTTRGPGGIRDLNPQSRPQDLSVMLFIPWWRGVGIGAVGRYEIPVVPNGFIPPINDQFSIEPSLSLGYRRSYGYRAYRAAGIVIDDERARSFDITPAVYGVWSFHITSKFRPYVALGFGWNFGVEVNDVPWDDRMYFFFDSAVGMFYRFSPAVALRAELGSEGPKVGFSFYL